MRLTWFHCQKSHYQKEGFGIIQVGISSWDQIKCYIIIMVQFPFNWTNIWGMCSWALIGCIWMCVGKSFWCWLCNPEWWWHPYSEHPDGHLRVPKTAAKPWGCSHGNNPWTCQKTPHCPRPQWTLVRNAERKESEWKSFPMLPYFELDFLGTLTWLQKLPALPHWALTQDGQAQVITQQGLSWQKDGNLRGNVPNKLKSSGYTYVCVWATSSAAGKTASTCLASTRPAWLNTYWQRASPASAPWTHAHKHISLSLPPCALWKSEPSRKRFTEYLRPASCRTRQSGTSGSSCRGVAACPSDLTPEAATRDGFQECIFPTTTYCISAEKPDF